MYNDPLNYNKDLNDLKTSRNGSYSNYLTSINKLPDPWMSQTPSNNNNVLLNSSVLPPPFSYIDIDKKMKREIIMRQVQEKEEQNAKNGSGNGNGSNSSGSGNPINNLNYGINVSSGNDLNDINNAIKADINKNGNMDNFMMNSMLNSYNTNENNSNNYNNNNNDIDNIINSNNNDSPIANDLLMNSTKNKNSQLIDNNQFITNINKEFEGTITNINTNATTNNNININSLNNDNNNYQLNIDLGQCSQSNNNNNNNNNNKNKNTFNLESKENSSNNLFNMNNQELTTLSQKYNLSKSDSININANGNSIKDDIIAGSSISNNSKISNKELLSVPSQKSSSSLMNSNNYLNVNSVKENKADSMSKHSDSGDIGKSISVCTLDIDSTELEIDLNQNSIKIDDSKIENTPHDPFEAQYKLLAQGGEDHIKELENRVLQGFESDDDIISIMSGERKNSLTNKDSSSKSVLKSNSLDINDINSINDDENKNEDNEENDDDDTEKEKPHNKCLKNKESINDSKSEINENEKTMKGNENFNLQSGINRILEKNKLNDVLMDKENKGEYSLNINLNKSINIDNLKGFEDTDESDEGEKEDNNKNKEVANNHSRSVTNLSNYENSSSKLSFKQEDMVFNWEDEYDKSKIENALKEINEKVNYY